MNLLIENAPDFIEVGGKKLTIKTDFNIWVKFLIAIGENNNKMAVDVLNEIFGELPTDLEMGELVRSIMNWLYQTRDKANIKGKNKTASKTAFDFGIDGNIIFCELWEHFPHLMKQGISFQTGLELIKLLISNENTTMHHRAFARCGDFSKMSKEQKSYWQKERAKYAIGAKQDDIDDIFSSAF
jgi:hypothetical protein